MIDKKIKEHIGFVTVHQGALINDKTQFQVIYDIDVIVSRGLRVVQAPVNDYRFLGIDKFIYC